MHGPGDSGYHREPSSLWPFEHHGASVLTTAEVGQATSNLNKETFLFSVHGGNRSSGCSPSAAVLRTTCRVWHSIQDTIQLKGAPLAHPLTVCSLSATTYFSPCRVCSSYCAHTAKWCSTMEHATATFSDAVPDPYCGMYTNLSHTAFCLLDSPCTRALGLQFLPVSGISPSRRGKRKLEPELLNFSICKRCYGGHWLLPVGPTCTLDSFVVISYLCLPPDTSSGMSGGKRR